MADVVVVAYPDMLKEAQTESPLILQELLRWVRAGGNLWIFRTGSDFQSIPAIESALGLATAESSSEGTSQDSDYPFWHVVPMHGTKNVGVDVLLGLLSPKGYGSLNRSGFEPTDENDALAVDSHKLFLVRAYGMGTVDGVRQSAQRLHFKKSC